MAYGIDPALPKEINDWNSPEHWIRSDLSSALDRNDMGKAKVLADVLQTTLLPGMQAGKNAAGIMEKTIDKAPDLLKATKEVTPSPTGQAVVDQAQNQAGIGQTPIDYTSLLTKRWSLPGKELLFK
ncbi:MAG TPA: hypothetical protein PLW50_00930 [Smithellaceae bacterium]|nr:hypothetical protein [Smithellaceae bacterium]